MTHRSGLQTASTARARGFRVAAGIVAVLCGAAGAGLDGEAQAASASLAAYAHNDGLGAAGERWEWPLRPPDRVLAGFVAPASRYAAGHRGVDLAAAPGEPVRAPADGVVSFSGTVVDRPLVTLELDDGTLVSLEPVRAAAGVTAGVRLARGAALGSVGRGGHCDARCLHLGVRVDGEYVSPMLFFAAVPAAVLLPLDPEG